MKLREIKEMLAEIDEDEYKDVWVEIKMDGEWESHMVKVPLLEIKLFTEKSRVRLIR